MGGVAQMPAHDLDEVGIALCRTDGGKLRYDPEGEAGDPETQTKTERCRQRSVEDGDGARGATEQDRFGQGAVYGNAKIRDRAAILKKQVLHQISAPPPKEKKDRKKLDAAKAMERPKTICTSRRKPPDVSPKASVRPVVMMMMTATILAQALRSIAGSAGAAAPRACWSRRRRPASKG
jgi:hypothetical protein